MADVETLPVAAPASRLNVTDRLAKFARADAGLDRGRLPTSAGLLARRRPAARHIGRSLRHDHVCRVGRRRTRIASGLAAWGVPKGTRLALLVKPGIEFVTLVFALLRAGMVIVLVDPGLGRRNLIRCLSEAEPEGFVAIGMAQVARLVLATKVSACTMECDGRTPMVLGRQNTRTNCASRRAERRRRLSSTQCSATTRADDPAAIISLRAARDRRRACCTRIGCSIRRSTEIQSTYGIEPGGIDLACFPLFALFNAAMGVTTVLPEMDFSRPAAAES